MVIHIDPKDAAAINAATFGYSGKKVKVEAAEHVTVCGLNWCGGSRNQYAACTLAGRSLGNAAVGNHAAPWNNPVEGKTVAIPPGCCLVQHTIFCGKDHGLTIYVHPSDMPRWLPAAADALTDFETIVLYCIRSYISSYRRDEAARKGVNARQYEAVVETLKAKGLLAKNGALTLAGKNAAAALPLSM